MATLELRLSASLPWWRNIYIATVYLWSIARRKEPDTDKMADMIVRHTKFRLGK